MNFEHLNKTFPAIESPGLAGFDPRLADITGLAQNGNSAEAASAIEALFDDGIYDVRLFGYYIYGVFLERGLGCLGEGFDAIERTLTENWQTVGPEKNRAKWASGTIQWLLKQLEKNLGRQESTRSANYEQWLREVDAEQVAAIRQSLSEARAAVEFALEEHATQVTEGIDKIGAWLEAFERSVFVEPEAEAEPEPEAEPASGGQAAASGPVSTGTQVGGAVVEGSVHLTLLIKKLTAFERLVGEGKMSLAAIVADDLLSIINDFDARLYFPTIFASFSRHHALHVSAIGEFMEGKEGPEWQALHDFYKVDLDGFVELE
ncbi:MAG: hypothetical protein JKY56_19355 [Kofleriaceae bacterium]|nr:hypothetical protein [Kofleriaceae bacterium]